MITGDIATTLGFQQDTVIEKETISPYLADVNGWFSSLYVYTDIVDAQFVGDVKLSLLRIMQTEFLFKKIPFWNDERLEAKKRRRQWISFVSRKRAKWNPSKSSVDRAHFAYNDFVRNFTGFSEKKLKYGVSFLNLRQGIVC